MKYVIILIILIISAGSQFGQSLEVGQKAPEIIQKSLDGKEIPLSSLKGKMVLVDFWASWCLPCRKENPLIVSTYHKYKDEIFKNGEGFTVYSVSMDTHPTAWRNAVRKDKLEWPSHVSDLKGWKNEAALQYKIKHVPYSYLIDGDGIVVAVNPRGEKLENALRKQKKKWYKGFFGKD
jgi:thiol-disulfide isomerase/thioredoxin